MLWLAFFYKILDAVLGAALANNLLLKCDAVVGRRVRCQMADGSFHDNDNDNENYWRLNILDFGLV